MAWVKERGGGGEESFLPSPPPPPLSLFGSCFISRAAKTENPIPRSFFAPEPNGNACYEGYTTTSFFCPGGQSIHWLVFKPLYNGKTTKACPQLPKISSQQRPVFFSNWWKSQEWSRHLILMVRWWLIAAVVFWLYSIDTATVSINSVYDTYSECSEPCPFCHAQTFWLKKIVWFFVYFISTMYYIWLEYHYGIQ